ncbi:unnamed protein product [Paramecium sonneborni]|uniref:Uncharacterized protein n=1 Tax=Paramecium sonneborni TaxID=65129 RepID=A0A8S1RMQ7_9CILI|nr:unnamed protein product [Paramecium sonneborni]
MTELYQDQSTYQLIEQIKVKQYCTAIAILSDNSYVLASCWKMIKVFQFKKEIMKQVNFINGHNNRITVLEFYKNYKVSSDWDGSIKIWSINRIHSSKCLQKIQAHKQVILGLVINDEKNCIISSSQDKKIKFWTEKNGWQLLGQTNLLQLRQVNLCYGITKTQNIKCWNIVQKIEVDKEGYKLCLISNNLFTFQQWGENFMDVYELDSKNQFIKTKSIFVKGGTNCDCLFPQQYRKSKDLLVNKNGSFINLIRRQENNEFIPQMSIDLLAGESIYGQMSQDSQYLITWDKKSSLIQIRKYQNIN